MQPSGEVSFPFINYVYQFIIKRLNLCLDNWATIEVEDALKRAGLDISEFTNGLQSMISENGKNLSGGQRQKIALARMIVKNPDVMIFDEATSNLDTKTSDLLKELIHSIFSDKICIIITHDPEMASIADTIINLSD